MGVRFYQRFDAEAKVQVKPQGRAGYTRQSVSDSTPARLRPQISRRLRRWAAVRGYYTGPGVAVAHVTPVRLRRPHSRRHESKADPVLELTAGHRSGWRAFPIPDAADPHRRVPRHRVRHAQ